MKMKNLIAGILCLSAFFPMAYGQDEIKSSSTLKEATVFYNGAELIHTAGVRLKAGANEVALSGLSPNIDLNSLSIRTTNNVVVSSYEFSRDFINENEKSPVVIQLEDSLKYYKVQIQKLDIETEIVNNMLSYLDGGLKGAYSDNEKTFNLGEFSKALDYYRGEAGTLKAELAGIEERRVELRLHLSRLQAQLRQEMSQTATASGVLFMNVSSPAAGNVEFTVSYFTPNAGWSPYYEINISGYDSPVRISQKARVRQNTGRNWDKVKLSLSTGTPSQTGVAPLFETWFLREMYPVARSTSKQAKLMQNSYSYDNLSEEAAVDEVLVSGYARAPVSSGEPIYVVDGNIVSEYYVNALEQSMIKNIDVLAADRATSLFGNRGSNGAIVITTRSQMDDFVQVADNDLNLSYSIDLPYTIPGNGKDQNIDLRTTETKAAFSYYTAPRLDDQVYILAEITDWEKLGLLSGRASIVYDGSYVGETYLDAASTLSKLSLTLGTEPRIAVKREKQTDYSTSKVIGSDVQQNFVYRTTVRNNLNRAVEVVVKDQYPISTQKNIVVELKKETTQWTTRNEDVGVLVWTMQYQPGETKTFDLNYSVKYPRSMTLNL